uniref:Uncharacterized protein n=1 Tax=Strombidium rassoulzadegani TaxID=1082188 RepID=A0A7S3FUJ0_9SPIT|mmetsp:Transcript_2015/g.3568  ORF Transcript_2015/g.3568 Transcript_2015/m.3568 type:complete len:204 (+) Transcript_2015:39-650(+)|eukprot:CAMPEP_0168618042 /NCGR_PEP_ID=MMETSP0449_2-20121227/5862_1 /TAXON_ID=1082188 /ORGANISM="Strombidium rassoulzadegani, Strain ras09" /LENGTH=203 /DNA_ID=CAMNT_0008658893 /DNA_START=18 /DNA_END=629 /DNA_ORIENTATION=+
MKNAATLMLFLGLISSSQAFTENNSILVQTQQKLALQNYDMESESEDDLNVQTVEEDGDDGIVDALAPQPGACEERLWLSQDELDWQMDQFSRKFNLQNYKNAMEIAKELNLKAPRVHTWELLDAAFSFPRVRRYEFVQQNMDMLEHFQDNLNTNISNSVNVDNFIRVAKTVVSGFNQKYHDGEFADPANTDPRVEAEKEPSW